MNISKNFSRNLIKWFNEHARPLPWRETTDPYKIWISEIMLQQTTVAAVIPFYHRWMKVFPDIEALACTSTQKVLRTWQGLGYYQRAKNLHRSAKIICDQFHGQLPHKKESLLQLPGLGRYTVGAILSFAFHQQEPIVDANIRRIFMRLWAKGGVPSTAFDAEIYHLLPQIMPRKNAQIFNQALMELGALICKAKNPLCISCPVKNDCQALKEGRQENIPKPKKSQIKKINVALALIKKRNKYFIQRRPPQGLLADLWEFPGGKQEQGESLANALKREIKEELNCSIKKYHFLENFYHYYTTFKVCLFVYECQLNKLPLTDETHRWVTLRDMRRYPFTSGSVKIIDHLALKNSDRADL